MSTTIKISDALIAEARRYGDIYSRSASEQIEYWSRIGKIIEENPDLSFSFIKDVLIAKQEKSAFFKFGKKSNSK
jgi:hypothetical protein